MVYGARIEQRNHQVQSVQLTSVVQRGPVLPRRPNCSDRAHVVPHPRSGSAPRQPVTPFNVGSNLRAEAEGEAASGQLLQRPCRHCGNRWTARKRHRNRGSKSNGCRRRRTEGEELEGVILCLFHENRVESAGFAMCCQRTKFADIEWRVWLSEPRVEFAKREESLNEHGQILIGVGSTEQLSGET